jgi:hypothetical protein
LSCFARVFLFLFLPCASCCPAMWAYSWVYFISYRNQTEINRNACCRILFHFINHRTLRPILGRSWRSSSGRLLSVSFETRLATKSGKLPIWL